MEDQKNSQNEANKVTHIDETTDNMLELIVNADDDDVDGVIQKLPFDVDAIKAFLKATGRENTPDAKLIIDAFTRKKKNESPSP